MDRESVVKDSSLVYHEAFSSQWATADSAQAYPTAPHDLIGHSLEELRKRVSGNRYDDALRYYIHRAPTSTELAFTSAPERLKQALTTPLQDLALPLLANAVDTLRQLNEATHWPPPLNGTVKDLYAQCFYGSTLPMSGLSTGEGDALEAYLAESSVERVIDQHLSGFLLHELCHGPRRTVSPALASWTLLECIASYLGYLSEPRHVFPTDPDVTAVPSLRGYALVGEYLASEFGLGALLALNQTGQIPSSPGLAQVVAAMTAAEWETWTPDFTLPFAPDIRDPHRWMKLIAAAQAPNEAHAPSPPTLAELTELPWCELPSWRQGLGRELNLEQLHFHLEALCLHVEVAQQRPIVVSSAPPDGELLLLPSDCRITAKPRHNGVFGEPASSLLAPAISARLSRRGIQTVRILGFDRQGVPALVDRMKSLCDTQSPSQPHLTITLTPEHRHG